MKTEGWAHNLCTEGWLDAWRNKAGYAQQRLGKSSTMRAFYICSLISTLLSRNYWASSTRSLYSCTALQITVQKSHGTSLRVTWNQLQYIVGLQAKAGPSPLLINDCHASSWCSHPLFAASVYSILRHFRPNLIPSIKCLSMNLFHPAQVTDKKKVNMPIFVNTPLL